jgi:phenylacetate-CoA ligase
MPYICSDDLVRLGEQIGLGSALDAALGASGEIIGRQVQAWYVVLLRQTLEWAERTVPYYRNRIVDLPYTRAECFKVLSDLGRLPVIGRHDIARFPGSFISDTARVDGASSTSGTTGRRLLVYSNQEEDRALSALRWIQRGAHHEQPGAIVLRVIPGNRRTHISQTSSNASDTSVITIGYVSSQAPAWFDYTDHLIEVMTETYRFGGIDRRISILHVTPPIVLDIITHHLRQKHIEPAIFGVTDIALSGGFASRQTRRLVTEVWRARYHHSYSCAEINGEAIADAEDPDRFHLRRSFYCEILDPQSLEPVAPGEAGIVVLTSLYPFQQAMPFIRYANGDIAQRTDDGAQPFVESLRPIGRVGDFVSLGPRQFVGTRDAFHALTAFDEVPQIPYPRFKVWFDEAERRLQLDAEVTLPGYSSTGLTPELVASRYQAEVASYGYPDSAMPKEVVCTLLPKNSLTDFQRIVPDR